MKKITLLLVLITTTALLYKSTFADSFHYETSTFKVYGNCEMCKERIETTLLKNSNIKTAEWDIKTNMLTVSYNPHIISLDEIYQILADAGHDTEKVKATNETYNTVEKCCHYRKKKK